jgi:hypothetical protein
MPGRRTDLRPKVGKDAPGAGQYDPKVDPMRKSAPSFSVAKTKRDASVNQVTNTPGIGNYDLTDALTKVQSATWR